MIEKNNMEKQQIWLSEWCPYNCKFCYNGGKSLLYIHTREGNTYTVEINKLPIKIVSLKSPKEANHKL